MMMLNRVRSFPFVSRSLYRSIAKATAATTATTTASTTAVSKPLAIEVATRTFSSRGYSIDNDYSTSSSLFGSSSSSSSIDFDADEHDIATFFNETKARTAESAERFFSVLSGRNDDENSIENSNNSIENSSSSNNIEDDENSIIERASKGAADAKKMAAAITANALRMSIDDGIKHLLKKRMSLDKELQKALSLEELANRANIITSNLYALENKTSPAARRTLTAIDWEHGGETLELILSEGFNSFKEEADSLFKKARKIRRGTRVVEGLLDECNENLDYLASKREYLLDNENPKVHNEGNLLRLKTELKKTGLVKEMFDGSTAATADSEARKRNEEAVVAAAGAAHTFREFTSPSGFKIFVGKNKSQNERLATVVAKRDDLWFHVRGIPGAHVVLKSNGNKKKLPTEDDLQMCADLAAYYSDYKTSSKVDVTMAEPKHIIKPPRAPLGAVTLRKEKGIILAFPENVESEYFSQ